MKRRHSHLVLPSMVALLVFASCSQRPVAVTTPRPSASATPGGDAAVSGGNTSVTGGNTTSINANVAINANIATGDVLTFVGRTISLDPNNGNHVRIGWPGIGVEASFIGTSVSATIRDYNNAYAGGPSGNSWWDVYLDGNKTMTFAATYDTNTYVLADNVSAGQHTVGLRKRTEANIGSTEFFGLAVADGGNFLTPPPHLTRHIEVIGASIEAGYGADGENCSGFQASQEDQDVAWPQLTADALGAELFNISYSGKGLVNNIDPLYDPTNTIPVIYELSDPMDFGVNWDFTAWRADVVIFDVGGNDWEGMGGAPDPNQFAAAFESFIRHILVYYPGAQFYVTMNSTDPPDQRAGLTVDFQKIVADLNQAGLSQVHYFEFAQYTGINYGCDGHPDIALHQVMANELIPTLRADLGW